MAVIVFPANPDLDDTYVVGDTTWRWDGVSWRSNNTFNGRMPAGRTDQRPADPKIGMIRYNTDIDAFEGYDASGWRPFYGTIITTPVGVAPAAETVIDGATTFTLVADAEYFNVLGLAHASSDWQISTDPAFGTTEVNVSADTSNLTSYEVTGGISTGLDTYYWRVRYRDTSGNVSDWSVPIEFDVLAVPPDTLGQSYGGGFYIGTICAASTCYYLIVAPNATGCAVCQWKTTRTTTAGTTSLVDGYSNTYGPMDNAEHPAGNWTATRTINGFSDWYLPAKDELNVLYVNDGGATNTTLPAGEGFVAVFYWSSTESSATNACFQNFSDGNQGNNFKTFSLRIRAVRREPI